MRAAAASHAGYTLGELIDLARADPVAVIKYGRLVVVVMAVEEYERLKALDETVAVPARTKKAKE